jgi:hypothetical protein
MNVKIKLITSAILLALITVYFAPTVNAQKGAIKTDSRILYHDGPVMQGTSNIYLIWYGNWGGDITPSILTDLATDLGSSPYFLINTTYPDASGVAPSGGLVYGGSVYDSYSQGSTLTVAKIQQIVGDQMLSGGLPADTSGIFIVIGSPDVIDSRPDGSTFCTPGSPPHHGLGSIPGMYFKYAYLGGAARCPSVVGWPFPGQPSPNDNFSADAMASTFARILNVTVTNPATKDWPVGGWFDRYGLENSDKCVGKFGTTYLAPNRGVANIQLGQRHYLIQQNWVNDRKGRCALSYP